MKICRVSEEILLKFIRNSFDLIMFIVYLCAKSRTTSTESALG